MNDIISNFLTEVFKELLLSNNGLLTSNDIIAVYTRYA